MFMHIDTTRFGALDIQDQKILRFPDGLPGFEDRNLFSLVPHHAADGGKGSPFLWLQSLEDGALAFLAMEPHQAFPDYAPRISRTELENISLADDSQRPRLYVLLTVPVGDPCGITANLMAPVIVNTRARLAKQVVLSPDDYSLRQRLLPGE